MPDWYDQGFGDDDVKGFIDACDSLLEELDELPERAEEYSRRCTMTPVREKVTGMRDYAEENQRVTAAMRDAVENMSSGVSKWRR